MNQIRNTRRDLGVSSLVLADRLGIAPMVLTAWEYDLGDPDYEAVAAVLGFPADYLRQQAKACADCKHWQPDDNLRWGDCGLTHLASGANQGRFCAVFEATT